MKPIGNIFGFDCVTCEHNRNCYGGNIGNQFRYCQKSTEKIQNLDNLEKQNQQLKDNWNKLRKYLIKEQARIVLENSDEDEFVYTDLLNKMKEIKQER